MSLNKFSIWKIKTLKSDSVEFFLEYCNFNPKKRWKNKFTWHLCLAYIVYRFPKCFLLCELDGNRTTINISKTNFIFLISIIFQLIAGRLGVASRRSITYKQFEYSSFHFISFIFCLVHYKMMLFFGHRHQKNHKRVKAQKRRTENEWKKKHQEKYSNHVIQALFKWQ